MGVCFAVLRLRVLMQVLTVLNAYSQQWAAVPGPRCRLCKIGQAPSDASCDSGHVCMSDFKAAGYQSPGACLDGEGQTAGKSCTQHAVPTGADTSVQWPCICSAQ